MRTETIFKPDYTVSPGEILEETLEVRGIKKKDFAERCGRTAKTISEIIAGKAPITPETALQFERVLSVSAKLWSNLETSYRLEIAEIEEQEKLEEEVSMLKLFPINGLVKLGFIDKTKDSVKTLSSLLDFFAVGSVDALNNFQTNQEAYYRKSPSFQSDAYATSAWLRCGEIKAEKITTSPYNADKFKNALKEIRNFTKDRINEVLPKIVELCKEAGVAFVLVPELKGTKISGATRWLTKDKALIQLSFRHKSDDHFWFTFFHEAGHILLHGKKEMFIDAPRQEDVSQEEKEANSFAQDILIPKKDWQNFILGYSAFTESIITSFANEQNIAPGIVLGRLQHKDQQLVSPASKLNKLKVWYEFS